MTVEACPRCGDQTLWSHNQGKAWCRLCGHTWAYTPPVLEGQQTLTVDNRAVELDPMSPEFRCDDPEGDWIKDQEGRKIV